MRHLMALGALLVMAPASGALAQQATEQAAVAAAPAGADAPAGEQPAVELTPNQRTLNTCRACHTFEKGQRALIGPNLHGVFGRRAAAIEGFRYSANMRALGETGHVWSDQTLRPWLANPKAVVPSTAMRFPGIPSEQHLEEFIPFLKEATGG